MTDFKQIIILRNQNKSQQEIASILGISRRSVIRYLKTGKIPVYKREKLVTRPDPLVDFMDEISIQLDLNPKLTLTGYFFQCGLSLDHRR